MNVVSPKKTIPSLEEALKIVTTSNYRLTRPRRALLETILLQKVPFSVPKLVALLKRKNGCDPVTIYRTLQVFEELGIIEKCDFSEGIAHYEVSVGHGGHHHHHIVCTTCKKVEPLEFCILERQEQVLEKLGYTNLKHRLEFVGVCPRCSR
jgi:Fur family transcriptional regulator, ferric uptake regulator